MKFMLKQLLRSLPFFFSNRRHRKPPGRENKHQSHWGTRTVFADVQLAGPSQPDSELCFKTQ